MKGKENKKTNCFQKELTSMLFFRHGKLQARHSRENCTVRKNQLINSLTTTITASHNQGFEKRPQTVIVDQDFFGLHKNSLIDCICPQLISETTI